MKHVYLETTIASYLASRPSRDLVIAARQELTREWWEDRRSQYALFVSQVVIDEAGDGDPEAAEKRLGYLEGIELLETTDSAVTLAEALLKEGAVPEKAADDALHIASATPINSWKWKPRSTTASTSSTASPPPTSNSLKTT